MSNIQTTTLPNGLRVITDTVSDSHSIGVGVWVGVGTRDEDMKHNGAAHMVEHMLFKGTSELGTADFSKEKPHLDSITMFYDQLGKTKDEDERKKIQSNINDQSVKASQYGSSK